MNFILGARWAFVCGGSAIDVSKTIQSIIQSINQQNLVTVNFPLFQGRLRGIEFSGTMNYLPYNKKLVSRAKELRKNMTVSEQKLWKNYLKTFPDRVYRQRPIENFIVDFYCPKLKLVIEVDGESHYYENAQNYDQERTQILLSLWVKSNSI